MVNRADETAFAPRAAGGDSAHVLDARPGSCPFVGNGDRPPLHSSRRASNDAPIAPAANHRASLAEAFLTAEDSHG